MQNNRLLELLDETPIIAAIKNYEGLEKMPSQ